ncbi:gypsy type transposase, partial [Tanacetum coccineum]
MDDLAIEIMVRNQQLAGLGVIYVVTAWLIHRRAKKRKQIFKKRNITSRSKKRKLDRVDTSILKVMGSLRKVDEAIKRRDVLLKERKAILERSQCVYTDEEILNELELMALSSAYENFATITKKDGINQSLQETKDWLYQDSDDEYVEPGYTVKLKDLKKVSRKCYFKLKKSEDNDLQHTQFFFPADHGPSFSLNLFINGFTFGNADEEILRNAIYAKVCDYRLALKSPIVKNVAFKPYLDHLIDEIATMFIKLQQDIDLDLFNLISASNPIKVKTGMRPRAAHEVPLLTVTASCVIEMEDTAVTSGTPSALEKLPLDFANEDPPQMITKMGGTADQVQDGLSHNIPLVETSTTTEVVQEPWLEKEVAAMGPPMNKRHRKRDNDEAKANAPPKVLRKDHAAFRPAQSTLGRKSLALLGLEV